MQQIVIINGPNLNLLGVREPEVYGHRPFDMFLEELRGRYPQLTITYYQSNVEGELINALHEARINADAVVINPGGYAHTSVAMADAIAAIGLPVVEVHISNVHAREEYRQTLLTGSKCKGVISGLGLEGYALAINYLLNTKAQ